jgi:hypothetical protein
MGVKLGAASPPEVGKHPASHQDPTDLPVAADPPHPLARCSDQVQRPRHRAARHQRLEDHRHQHPDQQRDRHPEDHEPRRRQERPAAVVLGDRATDRRDDRRGARQRDQPTDPRTGRRETQTQQAPHRERIHGHRQDHSEDDEQDRQAAHPRFAELVLCAAAPRFRRREAPSWPGRSGDSVAFVSTSTRNSSPTVGSRPMGAGSGRWFWMR